MVPRRLTQWRTEAGPWLPVVLTGVWVVVVTVAPTLLLPLAEAYRAFCEDHPVLALLTVHVPPVSIALLLSLVFAAVFNGSRVATATVIGSLRFSRAVHGERTCPPARLERLGAVLGLDGRLVYLPRPETAAFCYGFVRPRVAVSAGLLESLDDEQLIAVLAHEREHLRRRDPARYLAFRALSAAAFMFPLAGAVRRRREAWIELGADRAAITAAGRPALAGALLATLAAPRVAPAGAAALSGTEARIAHLTGAPALPPISTAVVAASAALATMIALAMAHLAASADMVRMVCGFCADRL